MINRIDSTPPMNLARKSNDPEMLVNMEAFFDFSFWMAEELQDLISQVQLQTGPFNEKFVAAIDNFEAPYEHWVEWE